MMHYGTWFGGYVHMLCGGLILLLIAAAVIALLVLAFRSYGRSGTSASTAGELPAATGSGRALEILKERYAR